MRPTAVARMATQLHASIVLAAMLCACAATEIGDAALGVDRAATEGTEPAFDPSWLVPDLYFRDANRDHGQMAEELIFLLNRKDAPDVVALVQGDHQWSNLAQALVGDIVHPAVLVAVIEAGLWSLMDKRPPEQQRGANLVPLVDQASSKLGAAFLELTPGIDESGRYAVKAPGWTGESLTGTTFSGFNVHAQAKLDADTVAPRNRATTALLELVAFYDTGDKDARAWLQAFHRAFVENVKLLGHEQRALTRPLNEGFIGGPCADPSDCLYRGGTCFEWDGVSVCSADCTSGCPDRRVDGFVETFCIDRLRASKRGQSAGQCLAQCLPKQAAGEDEAGAEENRRCPVGQHCSVNKPRVAGATKPDQKDVCLPGEPS